ncbi:MAG: gamma-glutamylcyclotransferase family protein [Bacteroidota bacterium]
MISRTQYLFSYGSLQKEDVQQQLLNRKLRGKKAVLYGYKRFENVVYGVYPVIQPTIDLQSKVKGRLFKVSFLDLYIIDEYETKAYKRIQVLLKSGIRAWAYVENLG